VVYYQTYQLKEERVYRVVLKYLHHTTEVEDILQEMLTVGHVARNIDNVHHILTKETLNLFFFDLEPANSNKDICNITANQNKIIHIEPPRTNKKHIPQCVRFQQYGHTRTYCKKRTCVSNAVARTTAQIAQSRGTRQQNAPCVAGIIRQTTNDVNITTTLSKETIHTQPP